MSDNLVNEFQKTYSNFIELKARIKAIYDLIAAETEENKKLLEAAIKELDAINEFYFNSFYSEDNEATKIKLCTKYSALYNHFDDLFKVPCTDESIPNKINNIKNHIDDLKDDLYINNLLHIGSALLWLIPVVAGAMIIPFTLPLLSINIFLGLAMLTATTVAILLSLEKIGGHLYDIRWTTKHLTEECERQESLLNKLPVLSKLSLFSPPKIIPESIGEQVIETNEA